MGDRSISASCLDISMVTLDSCPFSILIHTPQVGYFQYPLEGYTEVHVGVYDIHALRLDETLFITIPRLIIHPHLSLYARVHNALPTGCPVDSAVLDTPVQKVFYIPLFQ